VFIPFRHFMLSLITLLLINASPAWSAVSLPRTDIKPSVSNPPLRVLMIGNSYMIRNGGLDQVFKKLENEADLIDPIVKRVTVGGATLLEHSTNPDTISAIKQGGWDVVVLQDNGQILKSIYHAAGVAALYPMIKASNPGALVGFFQTQGQYNYNTNKTDAETLFIEHTQSNRRLIDSDIANYADSFSISCGDAWAQSYYAHGFSDASYQLHDVRDGFHPTALGTYLYALTIYRAIYGGSTAKFSNAGLDLSDDQINKMQAIADSMPGRGDIAPVITAQPGDVTVTVGLTATFTVTATGTPAPTFQWQKGTVNIRGATSARYTTPATVVGDSGSTYRCVVSNSVGRSFSRPATLTVNPAAKAPVITTQPTDTTVLVGQAATFTVKASGFPAPTFQWKRNGRDIVGATAFKYTTPVAKVGDSKAVYRCVVSNRVGSVTSQPAVLTIGWYSADIGSVAAAGSSRLVNGTWTIMGSGADIWENADEFHFVWQPVNGDVRITARVDSLTGTNPWSKAGVMIRDSSAANARNAFTFVTPDQGVGFQRRVTAGERTAYTAGSNRHAPYWVRLERIGNKLIGSSSLDGQNWKEFLSDTISFTDTVDVGLAVTSHNDGELATATFSQVELTTTPTASN
jgi:regulation of enolase protein 1 (concanavalin A-like superfamily)